jgi:hypothetical protein
MKQNKRGMDERINSSSKRVKLVDSDEDSEPELADSDEDEGGF